MVMPTLKGILRGQTIELEEKPDLPDGSSVEVEVNLVKETIFERIERLAKEGKIRPASNRGEFSQFEPLDIPGKPLSETLLEDRR